MTATTATIVTGKAHARRIHDQAKADVATLIANGVKPTLVSVQVGEDPASQVYVRNQQRHCKAAGIRYTLLHLDEDTTEDEIIDHVAALNSNPGVTGIIVQLPLPDGVNTRRIQAAVDPDKDVEGVSPKNIGEVILGIPHLPPCTAAGVVQVLEDNDVTIEGAEACVVGHSEIVGKPIAMMLMEKMATVTVCHIATRDVPAHTRRADILVSAVGKPNLITADMVKPGAFVLDVGINEIPVLDDDGRPVCDDHGHTKKRLAGDVDFDAVRDVAGHLTPVPGGVGPMTTAILIRNTVIAAAHAGRVSL